MEDQIDKDKLPRHIAVIMDGNGRWAKKKGLERIFGHRNAVKAVRETAETCARLGIQYLTLYAFSTENWSRPKEEVSALMQLLVTTLRKETKTLCKNNIRLMTVGKTEDLPKATRKELSEAISKTSESDGLVVNLALSYSGRWEITEAVKRIANEAKNGTLDSDAVTDELIGSYLSTSGIPDPELMIRTSGEKRISNFLLWQLAYAELYFTPVLWPDFRKEHLIEALLAFQNRERRFGKTGDQIRRLNV